MNSDNAFRIRRAEPRDFDAIIAIYTRARAFMAATGNPNQWTTYPTPEIVREDIEKGRNFVCVDDGDIPLGVFVFLQADDPTYAVIYGGAWLDDKPYGVVHRIASSGAQKGVGAFCLEWCYARCGNIRLDTHQDNKPMQNLLAKLGYRYCGIIHLANGDPRLAYQKGPS